MRQLEQFVKSEKCKYSIKWQVFYWLFGVVIYSSMITSSMPNPDAIWNGMYYKDSYGWEIGLGRWGIWLIQNVRGGVINSSFITISGLLYLAVTAYLVTCIFDIKTVMGRICAGALIICTPNIVSTLTYYYCSSAYLFSYLLSVVTVWLMTRAEWNKRGIWTTAIGSVCLLLSIGIYQAYVGVTIILCAIYLLNMLVRNTKFIEVVRKGMLMLSSGVIGIIAYLSMTKLIQAITQIEAVGDRGFATMGKLSLLDIGRGIVNAYQYFIKYYFSDMLINNEWGSRKEINIVFFVLLLVVVVCCVIKMKTAWYCKVAAISLVCLLPVCFMSILILAPEVGIQEVTGILMVPGMNYVYVLFVLLSEWLETTEDMKKIRGYVSFGVIILVLNMLLVLNLSAQNYMQYNMRKTYYVASEIARKIDQLNINTDEYELCVLGCMENGNYPNTQSTLSTSVQWLTASYGMIWRDDNGRNACWRSFLEQFTGNTYTCCSGETVEILKELPEVDKMGNFPKDNSVKVINNVIVVKLSE